MCVLTELGVARSHAEGAGMVAWWAAHGHDTVVDEWGQVSPLPKRQTFSIAELVAAGKPLMAHIVTDLGAFVSVGQAKKNGWDRPLELGTHTLKKKRIEFEVVA